MEDLLAGEHRRKSGRRVNLSWRKQLKQFKNGRKPFQGIHTGFLLQHSRTQPFDRKPRFAKYTEIPNCTASAYNEVIVLPLMLLLQYFRVYLINQKCWEFFRYTLGDSHCKVFIQRAIFFPVICTSLNSAFKTLESSDSEK